MRDTYTPCTSDELPSFAVKAAMIAERSALVAGRAYELDASAPATGTSAVSMQTTTTGASERGVTR